jgi:hypothetical protein
MLALVSDLPLPVNHVFVDFENVHEIDLAVIGNKAVSFNLLVGPQQKRLDAAVVEKLMEHAASVQLVRLTSAGNNALDFTLAYYLGRAVAADPAGFFHIVSKDAGYDPLIEHLRSKHIRARRHEDFTTLTFSGLAKPPAAPPLTVVPKPKRQAKSEAQSSVMDQWEAQVLEHLRKLTTTRPKTEQKLLSYLDSHLGHKLTEVEASNLIKYLSQAGHLAIDGQGMVTYYL